MNGIESLEHLSGHEVLTIVAKALAEHHERCHPPRAALPAGYTPTGKSLNRVRTETGLSAYAIRRIFRRLGLSGQIQTSNSRKTHCKRGHEFTSDNTYIMSDRSGRVCRECVENRRRQPENMTKDRVRSAKRRTDPEYRAYMKAYLSEYRETYRQRPDVQERARLSQRHRRELAKSVDAVDPHIGDTPA